MEPREGSGGGWGGPRWGCGAWECRVVGQWDDLRGMGTQIGRAVAQMAEASGRAPGDHGMAVLTTPGESLLLTLSSHWPGLKEAG